MKLGRYKTVLGYGTKACYIQSQLEGHTLLYELLKKWRAQTIVVLKLSTAYE
jgi:hypothetical protein